MSSNALKGAILGQLKKKSMKWGEVVHAVHDETKHGRNFIEAAMCSLSEAGEIKKMADGKYMPGGDIQGKYDDFTDIRLDSGAEGPSKRGTYEKDDPRKVGITPDLAV